MSEVAVVRVPLTEARAPVSGFSPRFMGRMPAPTPARDHPEQPDLFARGFEEGCRAAEAEFAVERAALQKLLATADAFQPEPSEELAAMIATTVERLTSELVGTVPVDRDWLAARVDRALTCIADADAARTLWLHPDDIALLDGADLPLEMHADPALERGALRIDCSMGWVEDSRSIHLDALRAALGITVQP